eukprot:sb/3464884/
MGRSILSGKNAKFSERQSLLPTTNLSNSDSVHSHFKTLRTTVPHNAAVKRRRQLEILEYRANDPDCTSLHPPSFVRKHGVSLLLLIKKLKSSILVKVVLQRRKQSCMNLRNRPKQVKKAIRTLYLGHVTSYQPTTTRSVAFCFINSNSIMAFQQCLGETLTEWRFINGIPSHEIAKTNSRISGDKGRHRRESRVYDCRRRLKNLWRSVNKIDNDIGVLNQINFTWRIITHTHIEQAQYLAKLRLDIGLRYRQDIVGSLLPTSLIRTWPLLPTHYSYFLKIFLNNYRKANGTLVKVARPFLVKMGPLTRINGPINGPITPACSRVASENKDNNKSVWVTHRFCFDPPRHVSPSSTTKSVSLSRPIVSNYIIDGAGGYCLHILFPCKKATLLQSDPDLVTSSGERVLVTKSGWSLNRGQIPLISYIGGNLSCH